MKSIKKLFKTIELYLPFFLILYLVTIILIILAAIYILSSNNALSELKSIDFKKLFSAIKTYVLLTLVIFLFLVTISFMIERYHEKGHNMALIQAIHQFIIKILSKYYLTVVIILFLITAFSEKHFNLITLISTTFLAIHQTNWLQKVNNNFFNLLPKLSKGVRTLGENTLDLLNRIIDKPKR